MGFTTYLLSRALKFKSFADTLHFVNIAYPGKYSFVSKNKNGRYKSPDFVAMDSSGNPDSISVVECKGAQSTVQKLENGRFSKVCVSGDNQSFHPERRFDYATD